MKSVALIGGVVGLGVSIWLLESFGVERILSLLRHAGLCGILAVMAFHLIEVLFSAVAWQAITGPTEPRPSWGIYILMRWIRDAVNNLLPVAQIGGEVVAVRLLQRRGMRLTSAIAGTVADVTMQMLTQMVFTVLGLILLIRSVGDHGIVGYVTSGLIGAMIVAACFLGAQWLGIASRIERLLMRFGQSMGWTGTAKIEGLHKALIACYRSPRRVMLAALWQMVSWLLGGVEICLALHFLGQNIGIVPGIIIESLSQALKAVGFVVPGTLGVQEGGYIIIGQIFGLSPEIAIALSLMKRLREVGLGVPGLVAWQRMELQAPIPAAPSLSGTSR